MGTDDAIAVRLLGPEAASEQGFLKSWYGRLGYRLVRTTKLDDGHPHLAPLLATPCDLEAHEKPLRP